jgi:hypothetical protein
LFRLPAAADGRGLVEIANQQINQSRKLVDAVRRESTADLAFMDNMRATMAHSRALLHHSARQLRANRHWTAWG